MGRAGILYRCRCGALFCCEVTYIVIIRGLTADENEQCIGREAKTSAETLYFADDDEVTEISERLIGRNRKVYEELAK